MRAMIVPGSGLVRAQAEEEGLADIFKEAGFEWRLAGCSMCLAMNPTSSANRASAARPPQTATSKAAKATRAAHTLCRPAMAAAAAITGHLTDIRDMI